MTTQLPARFGKYELIELVARGGMAEIFRARTVSIGGFERFCAIKKILPHLTENQEFITMLIDEAKICVSLQHANIVQVMELGKIDQSYYIAMEYVHGMDLATILKTCAYNNFIIPFEYTVYVGMQVCAGLGHAHTKTDEQGQNLGIIHRDVSPHNILISYDGEVKIIDFGVAKASIKMTHTMSGIIKGKLLYMAPEQAMAKEMDHRADLFAVGLVLYKMTTHQLPFEGENEFQIYNKLVQGKVTPPKKLNPKIPDSLDDLIMKSLRKKPEQRFQDAFEFRNALATVLAELSPGWAPSRLAQFMEIYFPPRPLVEPEPLSAPGILQMNDASMELSQADYLPLDDELPGLPPNNPQGQWGSPYPPYGNSPDGMGGQVPAAVQPAQPDQHRGPYGAGHRAGPTHEGLQQPAQSSIGLHDRTIRVSVPYGVGLLNQETIPATAGLFAHDLFPDGIPAGPDSYPILDGPDGYPPRIPRFSLAMKILLGTFTFLGLLIGGIFGGYYLLQLISAPEVEVTPHAQVVDVGILAHLQPGSGSATPATPATPIDGGSLAEENPGGSAPTERHEDTVVLTLRSMPQGAQIHQQISQGQGQLYIGQTDMELARKKRSGGKITLVFHKDGYQDVTRVVELDRDQIVQIRLRRE